MKTKSMSDFRCRICGNRSENRTFLVPEMMYGLRETFSYFQCARCDCLQIEELLNDMAKYYPADYYSLTHPRAAERKLRSPHNFFRKKRNEAALFNGGLIGKLLCRAFPLDKQDRQITEDNTALSFHELKRMGLSFRSRILDVGCGTGKRLLQLQKIGFEYLRGVDPFVKDDIEYAAGVKITKGHFHDISDRFDFIMFHHSFEHVPDPVDTMISISRILSEKGICLIRIPVVSSYAWNHYGVNWVQIDAPRHLYLHGLKSMEVLTGKAGLTIECTIFDSTSFQFLGSEQYLRGIPLMSERSFKKSLTKSIFSAAEVEYYKKEARKLNKSKQGDQAAFYISKAKDK